MPQDFTVPAKGALDYQYISVPTHFTEDKWVEMAEVRPGDRSVVHHANIYVDRTRAARQLTQQGASPYWELLPSSAAMPVTCLRLCSRSVIKRRLGRRVAT